MKLLSGGLVAVALFVGTFKRCQGLQRIRQDQQTELEGAEQGNKVSALIPIVYAALAG
jgi:hypothetical protein